MTDHTPALQRPATRAARLSAIEQALLGNVYETLVSRGQDNSLTAGLAKQWDVSEDGLTYTFTLQSGLRFSNGHALDSSDVVWSLQQAVQQQYVGSEALDHLAEVANPDKDTVIALRGNDSYWGQAPASSQITLRYFADESSMVEALRNGEIDMALPLSAATAQSLSEDPTLMVATGESLNKTTLVFNNDADSILSDSQMRQAIRYLVDTAVIAQSQAGRSARSTRGTRT